MVTQPELKYLCKASFYICRQDALCLCLILVKLFKSVCLLQYSCILFRLIVSVEIIGLVRAKHWKLDLNLRVSGGFGNYFV